VGGAFWGMRVGMLFLNPPFWFAYLSDMEAAVMMASSLIIGFIAGSRLVVRARGQATLL
jgi:uncharacterized membrane protein